MLICGNRRYKMNTANTNLIPKPSAQEILLFVDTVANMPPLNSNTASEALQKWMNGTLTQDDADRYKAILQFPQNDAKTVQFAGSTAECAACIAACCGFFGCNPFCVSGCVAGVCK